MKRVELHRSCHSNEEDRQQNRTNQNAADLKRQSRLKTAIDPETDSPTHRPLIIEWNEGNPKIAEPHM